MPDEIEKFLKYDYSETRELLKTFLTLISATLVLSVTFSEKVIHFDGADGGVRVILFVSWALLLFALVCAGVGMCFIAASAGKAIYGDIPIFNLHYYALALISWAFVLLAGASYVGGLGAMAWATASAIPKPQASQTSPAFPV